MIKHVLNIVVLREKSNGLQMDDDINSSFILEFDGYLLE